MRVSIIYTKAGPFRVFKDEKDALKEYDRLLKLVDFVDYSLMNLPVEGPPHNKPLHADKGKQRLSEGYRTGCFWELDEFDGCWNTKCGHVFYLEEGDPKENEFKYCCYCGRQLED